MARGEIQTDRRHIVTKRVQSRHEDGHQGVDVNPRVPSRQGGSSKRKLEEEGVGPRRKWVKGSPELWSRRTPQSTQEGGQAASSRHHPGFMAAQAHQAPFWRGRGRQLGSGHGSAITQSPRHIQYDTLEHCSPLAQQSRHGWPGQPMVALASPDATLAHTDLEVARSWRRRMSGNFKPPIDG